MCSEPAPKRHPRSILEWWHLLSLDAPTVAAVWTLFVAYCAGVHLSVLDPVAMFVAVWMLYAADRLLDARPLSAGLPGVDLEERHWFHHRHRKTFLQVLVCMTVPLACLLHWLAAPVLHLYTLLAVLLAGWLVVVHAQAIPAAGTRRLPKEFAVGLFFPAAVFIPVVARAPALRLALLPDAALFAGVCSLNCLLLYGWEHPVDRTRAHASTRWALRRLRLLCLAWVGFALFTCLAAFHSLPGIALPRHVLALPMAAGASVLLLLGLDAGRRSLPALRLRALADLVLLTPLVFVLLSRGRGW